MPTYQKMKHGLKKPFQFIWKGKRKFITFSILFIITGCIGLYFFVLKDIPKASSIALNNYPQSTKIFDRNGVLLYTIYTSKNQSFVPLSQIPKTLQNATIAIEDRDFYHHGAIDFRGIARATFETIFKKQIQGGSTITQQLVKNSLLTPQQTITRKLKEIILATIVEAIYSKEKILEMYLNQVSYGGTAWGVEAASYDYFDKPVSKLDVAESAFLAGLPEAPSLYSPFGSQPELGKVRQQEVLNDMQQQGYISRSQEQQAIAEKLHFAKFQDKILAPHFVLYIKSLLEQKYGQRMVEQGGLQVVTSLDLSTQNFVQSTVTDEVAGLKNYNVSNGAALVTNPKTGEILAMVGSRDYFDASDDGNVNVTISRRQPGSSIKPINYAVGLIKGYTAATPFIDEHTCFPAAIGDPAYCPVNYDGKFHGVVQMRTALANSLNIPAVKMLEANGVTSMIATASAMGITTFDTPDRYGLSLTLGGGEVTMTNMAEAFGVFANLGHHIPLQPILKVTDNRGTVLEHYTPPQDIIFAPQIIPDGVAYIISNILQDNAARQMEFGANSPLQIGSYPVSVKTGTTNDFRDNWTIGYTPSYVVAVWVGNNNNQPMNGLVSGITGAAPVWHTIMSHLILGKPKEQLLRPDDVIGMTVCSDSGLLPGTSGCPTRFEYFMKGDLPKGTDPGMQNVLIDKTTNDLPPKDPPDTNVEPRSERIITDPTGDRYCVTCPHPTPTPTP